MFTFDSLGSLQTDLFIKKTDSRSYLHFRSSHPNHIYSGIVYSQCLRLRRIINSQERLKEHLTDLKKAFLAAGYPRKMVENISNKVLNSERSLLRKVQAPDDQTSLYLPIRVISTYGSDDDLVKLKELALGAKHGPTSKCNAPRCKCCELVKGTQEFKINGKKVKASPGNCLSYNIIYLFQCSVCGKAYVSRTTRSLRVRTGEHRVKYYKLLSGDKVDETSDEYSLGLHLLDHGFKQRDDFNKIFYVSIIDNSSGLKL